MKKLLLAAMIGISLNANAANLLIELHGVEAQSGRSESIEKHCKIYDDGKTTVDIVYTNGETDEKKSKPVMSSSAFIKINKKNFIDMIKSVDLSSVENDMRYFSSDGTYRSNFYVYVYVDKQKNEIGYREKNWIVYSVAKEMCNQNSIGRISITKDMYFEW